MSLDHSSFLFRFPGPFVGKLTYIPRNIADLRNLVVLSDASNPTTHVPGPSSPRTRSFTRVVSAPATYTPTQPRLSGSLTSTNPFLTKNRAPSISTASQEASIQLFLSGNAICSLPRELFSLKGLTVLSLRKPVFLLGTIPNQA